MIGCLMTALLDDSLRLMWLAMREMRLPGLHGMFRKPLVADDEPVFRILFLRSFHDLQSPVGFSTSKMVTPSIEWAIAAMVMGIPWRRADMASTAQHCHKATAAMTEA
jgi:hypothetical protein